MTNEIDKIDLPTDGACPCGNKSLVLAQDQTEYTTVTKSGEWEFGASNFEQTDYDTMGGVRLFCPSCGQYFNVPKELE